MKRDDRELAPARERAGIEGLSMFLSGIPRKNLKATRRSRDSCRGQSYKFYFPLAMRNSFAILDFFLAPVFLSIK